MDRPVGTRRTQRTVRRYRPALVMVTALLVTVSAAVAVSAAPTEEQLTEPGVCNRNTALASSLQFTVPSGAAVWAHIPLLGITPELEAINDPVTVVVFEGPHHAVPVFPALREGNYSIAPTALEDVVCVLAPTGEEMYYYGVDTSVLNLEGVTVDRKSE